MRKLSCGRDHRHGRLLTVKMQSLKEDSRNIEKGSQVNTQGTKWLRECFPDSSDQASQKLLPLWWMWDIAHL